MIKYNEMKGWGRPTYRTPKYGNLLSDSYQGTVDQSGDGTWCGWFDNLSRKHMSEFRFGFKSRSAAARWVNNKLRKVGVK